MKILLLADPSSVHTQRWAFALAERNYQVVIVGLSDFLQENIYLNHPNIEVFSLNISEKYISHSVSDLQKLAYLKGFIRLQKLLRQLRPDIIHAHYATSYGLLGSMTFNYPFFLSVWGDDVLIFPKRSWLHKQLLIFNLSRADLIFSTSNALAKDTMLLTHKPISVIPFGIDLKNFKQIPLEKKSNLVIGTVKSLEEIYGIDILIIAFGLLCKKYDHIHLLLVGGGSLESSLKQLVIQLGLDGKVTFAGKVSHQQTIHYHNQIDIFVALSRSESFGVAVLEAQACSKPVVVSDVGGLPEIIEDGVTGIVVPSENPDAAALGIGKLIEEPSLRESMGKAGRRRVEELYDWRKNVDEMIETYNGFVSGKKSSSIEKVKQLYAKESVKKIFRSFQYLSTERLIKLFVGVLIHAWLARYLGPEKFGKLSYVLNYTSIFLPFVTFGLDDVLTKYFLKHEEQAHNIVSTQLQLRFLTGLIGYILLSVILLLDPSFEFKYKMMIMIFGSTLFFRVFDVIEIFYQSQLHLRPVFWARNIGYLSGSGLKALGIIFRLRISYFVISYIWEVLSWKTINVITYVKSHSFGKIDGEHRRMFLRESLPLFLGAFITMLDMKLGNLTLIKFHNEEAVGNFSVVMILVDLWNFLPAAICASIYPAIYNAKEGRSGSYSLRVQFVYDFLFWLGLCFAVSVTILSPIVTRILYGSRFPEMPSLLAIAAWLGIFSFLSFGRIKYYALEDQLKNWVFYSFVSFSFNLFLQFILVPTYHEKGVLMSMLASPILSLFVCSLFSEFVRKEFGIIFRCLLGPLRLFSRYS
jgi:glycosyltransferase involved in cell wall biosynthesis/O-antigen/teichoic acid export membrane protein